MPYIAAILARRIILPAIVVGASMALTGCAELDAIGNIGVPGKTELSTTVLADIAMARKVAVAAMSARDVECMDRWAAIITPLNDGDTSIPGAATLIVFKRAAVRILDDCPVQIPRITRLLGL